MLLVNIYCVYIYIYVAIVAIVFLYVCAVILCVLLYSHMEERLPNVLSLNKTNQSIGQI